MGSLSFRAWRERENNVAAGLPPYVPCRRPAGIGPGGILPPAAPTDHPGSKRKFRRLKIVTDSQGVRHVVWPSRKRKGRQAPPLPAELRHARYRRQNGGHGLTPAQSRRLRKKRNQAMAVEAV